MFLRLVLTSMLACAFLSAPLMAGADAASRNIVKGKTSQGYKIKVRMYGHRAFKLVHFKADLKCRDGSTLQLTESGFLKTPVRKGRFKDAQFGKTDSVRLKGKVTGKRLQGRMRLEDKLGKKKIRCKSKWIRFNVKR